MVQPSNISSHVILAPYTTLGVGGPADFFATINTIPELREVVLWARQEALPITVIGGGSNVLVYETGVRGLVLNMAIGGITYREEGDTVYVTAGAGVVLDTLVDDVVKKGLWGLENLSHIPGTVGAVPIQNVGAYGVEGKDCIDTVSVYDTDDDTVRTLSNEACAFSYRDSLFKHGVGAHLIVLSVTFVLSRIPAPRLTYADLAEYVKDVPEPSLHEIRNAVIAVRTAKLPDWHTVGTAGSFFKNPIVTKELYASLTERYPGVPGYPEPDGRVKVSLGWVLDKICGLKGHRVGHVSLYEKQALVLVCEHGATAHDVELFVQEVRACVEEKTGMVIEQEVRVLH